MDSTYGKWQIIESMITSQPTFQGTSFSGRLSHIVEQGGDFGEAYISTAFDRRINSDVAFCKGKRAASGTANDMILCSDVII